MATCTTYFIFFIKPNDYSKKYLTRLVSNIEDKLNIWCNKWIFCGDRLIMMNSVLEAILVYWDSISYIPHGTMENIRRRLFNFLWRGSKSKQSFPWISWKRLTLSKELRGLVLKYYPDFARALDEKEHGD